MSVSMRTAKFPDLPTMGFDIHKAEAGVSVAGLPLPMIPLHAWVVTISNHMPALTYGKFTTNTITEYQFDILAGHDWGILQPHIPLPPMAVTPSIVDLLLGSSHKYFLPSYAVQETPGMGALSKIGASATPVAITSPVCMIPGQDCMQISVAPTSVMLQLPTTRWVGFGLCDLVAAAISMGTDAAGAAASAAISEALPVKGMAGAVLGAVLNAINTAVQNTANANAESPAASAATVVGLGLTGVLAPAAIGLAGGRLADAVGNSAHKNH